MSSPFEILLPIRNPSEVFEQTIASLVGQSHRDFSVLISDNHSTSGAALVDRALAELSGAGIAARKVRPPSELQRVEHWNWLHFQSSAAWVKPLFAGDWLEPDYLASVVREIEAAPACRYVYCGFQLHDAATGEVQDTPPHWAGGFRPPGEMRDVVLRYGHQFGPPCAAAYERSAFIALGGYRPTLPICADSLLYCAMAARFGAVGIARPLSHFNLHGGRFSNLLPARQRAVYREKLTYLTMLAYHAWTERVALPRIALVRMFLRELRQYWRERRAAPQVA